MAIATTTAAQEKGDIEMIVLNLAGISLQPDFTPLSASFETHSAPPDLALSLLHTLKSANYSEAEIHQTCMELIQIVEKSEPQN